MHPLGGACLRRLLAAWLIPSLGSGGMDASPLNCRGGSIPIPGTAIPGSFDNFLLFLMELIPHILIPFQNGERNHNSIFLKFRKLPTSTELCEEVEVERPPGPRH